MPDLNSSEVPNAPAAYQALCTSYNAIDGFRGTLLGFLPLATGGIFLAQGTNILSDTKVATLIGLFGFLITCGLFIFEIYGIRRCTHLIILGQYLERLMKTKGQFLNRPFGLEGFLPGNFCRFISEPMASGVIYPAVGAAWLYLGTQADAMLGPCFAAWLAIVVFVAGFCFMYRYNKWLAVEDWKKAKEKLAGSNGNGSTGDKP